ncbi:hypothetical protein ARMSODRAFT_981158 [Armillaria solidipes]|uniref:DDE-1 domain-containing protein n=1 Tax=Armillaria solidipes TaxID=1076256 RepID=A0A2H3B6V3_9AGAR|nr:hypothetical protein ARMSODRAFT_981158 [Armillaria solidipes]
MSGTYWLTQAIMQDLVETIIAPYFDEQKKQLGQEHIQFTLWKINCWSMHKLEEFHLYIKENYPYIILCFIPRNYVTVRMLHNRSVGWIVEAIQDISNKDFVKKLIADDSEHHFEANMAVEELLFDEFVPDDDSDIPLTIMADIVLDVDSVSIAYIDGFVTKSNDNGIKQNGIIESDCNESII